MVTSINGSLFFHLPSGTFGKNRNNNNINNLNHSLNVNLDLRQTWEYKCLTERNSPQQPKVRVSIRWIKPPQNSIKLNIDRAFSKTNLHVGLWGVFRNCKGDWIFGFHKSCYATSSLHVELLALEQGLKTAMEMSFTSIEIETDSTEVIKMFNEDNALTNNTLFNCRLLMYQLNMPTINHNFRDDNAVAHSLAKEGINRRSIYHAIPPFSVKTVLERDKSDLCFGTKLLTSLVCNILIDKNNRNVLKDYIVSCMNSIIN